LTKTLKDIKTIMFIREQLRSESNTGILHQTFFFSKVLWVICHCNKETKSLNYNESMVPVYVHGLPLES